VNMQHHNTTPQNDKAPKTYLIGSVEQVHFQLRCCPHASSLTCRELETGLPAIIAIPCRRWGCKFCGQRKAFQLAIRCELAKPTRLITLTIDPKRWITPKDAYDGTRRKVADFAKNLRKRLHGFEYFRVLEATKKGWPHYHFVARCSYIPQAEVSRVWAEMTGAPIVDIRAINQNTNVFKYILKYLCKQQHVPWTNRRVAWSKSFFPKPEEHEHRQNPYINRSRNWRHPADVMNKHHFGWTAEERKPGVWVLHNPEDATTSDL
jgi:hypothetical protein